MTPILIAAALAAAGAAAQAHAVLEGVAAPGATSDFAVRIGHGCDGLPTIAVEATIPDALTAVRPMAKPGWTVETAPGLIRWSGGSLPDDQFDRFVFRARAADGAQDGAPVPVRQVCDGAEMLWADVAAPGRDPHDLPAPAPLLRVADAPHADHASSHGGHAASHGGHAASHGGHAASRAGHDAAHGAAGEGALGPIRVTGGFVRAAATGGGASTAYMTVTTEGAADRLIAAASPVAARVELHAHLLDDAGVARMRRVEAIDVAPGAPAELEPGGLHVMLMGVAERLGEGDTVDLTLSFEAAGDLTVTLPVRAAGGHAHRH